MSTENEVIKKIIENSGNSFHSKVLKYLQKADWTVLISPYYNDNVSNKPREIDLIAEKAFRIKNPLNILKGTVNVKLFIECKYISHEIVFWFHNKDKVKSNNLAINMTHLPSDYLGHMKEHHYISSNDQVAKLFADGKKSSAENEIFYKALNQSLNAMLYFRSINSMSLLAEDQKRYIQSTINYPVIICDDFQKLYRVDIESDNDPSNIKKNFQLEVNYAYFDPKQNNNNEYFLIDILNFKDDILMKNFLSMIEADVDIVGDYIDRIGGSEKAKFS